jgi:hypothetical protein
VRSETKTLSAALYELARTVESGDGVANAAIAEAAERLDEQTVEIVRLRARDKQWIEFALAVGKHVGCLASTHPDANDHVLRKLMPLSDAAAPELLEALKKVAQSLEWHAHGCCRGIDAGGPLPTNEAVELAKRTIAKALVMTANAKLRGATDD